MSLSAKQPKPKTCKNPACAEKFTPRKLGQSVCSPKCALAIKHVNEGKARKALAQVERAEIKVRKEKLKSRGEYVKDAEKAVRDYRRNYELSIGSGCISCGEPQEAILAAQGWKTGGAFDAGHFLGKGARPELRLEPDNIWLQCKGCNGGSAKYARKGESVAKGFREGLIARIGLAAVEGLEADHAPRKYTIEELKNITVLFRRLTRELKRAAA